jgi:hypothetical protein
MARAESDPAGRIVTPSLETLSNRFTVYEAADETA